MTILIDGRPWYDPLQGGVTRVANGLLPALIQVMPEHACVVVTTGMRKPSLPVPNHRHILLPNKIWSALSSLGFTSLDRACRKDKPDILFLPNIGFTGMPTIPYALLVHDLSFLIEPRWYSWRGRLWHHAVHAKQLMKQATWLFAVSERTKQDLIDLLAIPAEHITVIPMGRSPESLHDELPIPLQHTQYVVALGGTNRRKNAACAIEAVAHLRQDPDYRDIILVLLGTSTSQKLPPYVMGLGHPDDRGRDTLLRHSSAFLYPSWYEGFGLPLHEGAQFHTPCIASTAGALPETAPSGTLFAPPSKPHLWVQALKMIFEKPEDYKTQTNLGTWEPAATIIRRVMIRN